jgi:hypothetical protein
MKSKFLPLLTVLVLLIFQSAAGKNSDPPVSGIWESLEQYSSAVKPQKAYLHMDKSDYRTGETIWFKTYLLDGSNHLLHTDTSNIYVDLIHADGNTMESRILMATGGVANGEIKLGPELPDGNYVIRAYSGRMRNFGEDDYFTRYLYIKNPGFENAIRRVDVLRNRRYNRQLRRMSGEYEPETFFERVGQSIVQIFKTFDHEVGFFPEGGNLVAGTTGRVAIKVADPLGAGQHAEGLLLDMNGYAIAPIDTDIAGIGVFEFAPEAGNSYRAHISINGGRFRNFDLPEVINEGYALRIDQDDSEVRVTVASAVSPANPLYSGELILIGHTRGKPHYGTTLNVSEGTREVVIDKQSLPTGITHFTVFTQNHKPVAERLVFINNNDALVFSPNIKARGIIDPGSFDLMLTVNDNDGNPVEGTFSLSAVAGQPDNGTQKMNILSYMMLNSDLKGLVEDDFIRFFQPGNNGDIDVDPLLLTHGWRKFNWNDVLAGDLPEITYGTRRGLSIGGRLIDPARNESLRNYPVNLRVLGDYDDTLTTRTERNGVFAFTGLFYEGQVNIQLSSRRLPANYPPEIELNVAAATGYEYEPGIYTRERQITSRGDDWSRSLRRAAMRPRQGITPDNTTAQLYGTPDQTIYIDYDTSTERNLFEVLERRATGLTFEGGRIIIRGASSLVLDNEARFMLDGVFVDRNTFLSQYPRDIQRIEIFRGPRAAIFGVRGGTGVILAYTRRPGYQGLEDALDLVMLGYHSPAEFYTDAVTVSGNPSSGGTGEKTILWNPDVVSDGNGTANIRIPLIRGMENMKVTVEGVGFSGGIGAAEFNVEVNF